MFTLDASETVFEAAWWGTSLPNVRPSTHTYSRYDYAPLSPPPGVRFDGTFDWLRVEPSQASSILDQQRSDVVQSFAQLARFCSPRSITLPLSLVTFLQDMRLAERIRSCTACFLDLATDIIASPKGDRSIVRFLADQQGCLFWYLFLAPRQEDHCVVVSKDYFGSDTAEVWPEPSDPDSIEYCAPGFESFLFRFWLENEYWFASHGYGAPSPTAENCMRAYGWTPVAPVALVHQNPRPNWLRRLLGG
jgi:hypothetical protein